MRKPRDIDAELAALAERAAALKARRVTQLGELVIASGADALGADILMGALSAAAAETNDQTRSHWRRRGEAVAPPVGSVVAECSHNSGAPLQRAPA